MKRPRPLTPRASERRDKDVDLESATAALRVEEAEAAAATCAACAAARAATGDPSAFCDDHLRHVYGV